MIIDFPNPSFAHPNLIVLRFGEYGGEAAKGQQQEEENSEEEQSQRWYVQRKMLRHMEGMELIYMRLSGRECEFKLKLKR